MEPSQEYKELSPNIPAPAACPQHVQTPLQHSLAIAREILNACGCEMKIEENEWILWHGTSHSSRDNLLQSLPRANRGAYGFGFYLTPFYGKADQYTTVDETNGMFAMIGYRVCPGADVQFNPHLNRETQSKAETNKSTSYVSLPRRGNHELRYHEVVLRGVLACTPFCVLHYDRYHERFGLPGSSQTEGRKTS